MAADQTSNVWAEWRRVTRFLNSSRIALAREEQLWTSLEVADNAMLSIKTTTRQSTFKVSVIDHIKTLKDHPFLFSLILVYTYSLAEAYARIKLDLGQQKQDGLNGGIESWGDQLLTRTGHGWDDVFGGQAGIVEVSCVRNAIAHGATEISASMVSRFTDHGLAAPWVEGNTINLDYDLIKKYRARLKSLMRFADKPKRSYVKKVSLTKRSRRRFG